MYVGYGYFNNTELWSNERVVSYLKGDPLGGYPGLRTPSTSFVANCGCDTARPLFCDQGSGIDGAYVSPAADDAPWYDPAVPESAEFAGLFVEDIVGFDSTVRREVSEGAINGGSLGPLKLGTRSVTVTGWLRAKTCCAAEYGLRWLSEALVGNSACQDCKLGDLYMLKCCPDAEDSICYLGETSEAQLVTSRNPDVSMDNLGGGIFRIVVDDPDQTFVVSDSEGAINNTDGFLSTCLDGTDPLAVAEYRFTVVGEAIERVLYLPFAALSAVGTAPSGDGASITIDFDSAFVSGCPDLQEKVDETNAAITQWLVDFVPAALETVENFSQGRCLTEQEGPDPLEFARFFHRTGLTDGPKVLERRGTCCTSRCGCVNLRVQFTLTSELPYIFGDVDWCLQDSFFPRDELFCNPLSWCDDCTQTIGTQIVEREVVRPECQVLIRHDGTWCAEGWVLDPADFPPADCLLVPDPESYDPAEDGSTTDPGVTGDPCLIDLNIDFSWDPVNFNPADGFAPEFCTLQINDPLGTCEEQDTSDCTPGDGTGSVVCDVTLVGTPGDSGTWTSPDFDPAIDGFPPDCNIDITNGSVCLDPVDEVQEIRVDATSGTFSLTFSGDTTGALAFNSSETAVRLALEALTSLSPGDVTVSGGPGDSGATKPYVVTFVGTLAGTNVSAIVGNNISLAGGGASISVTTVQQGSPAGTECGVKLIYNVATGTQTWEGQWPAGSGGSCDCYTVSQFCIEGGEKCLVKIIYNETTGEATWEPIRWDGNINNDACVCFEIAQVEVITAAADCPPTSLVGCPVLLSSDGTYTKIGWSWVPADGIFPPADCDITIANPQQTGPLIQEVEIAADLFVPDCGPFPIVPPDAFAGFTSCYCEPWASFRACCTYDNPYLWNEATSVIQVKAGSGEIRNMKIEAYRNPWGAQGVACPCDPNDEFWKCREPCSTLYIPQLPSGATITIDSRIRVAEVTFAGGKATNGLRYIESADGRPFDWFDVSQCAQLCIVVAADCTTIAEDAQVSVGFVSRYLASGW